MSKNRLTITSVLLLGLIVVTVVMVKARKADYAPATTTEIKLPKIAEDKIDELVVSGSDQPTTHLVKKGDQWRVTEPIEANADQEAVKSAVKKIADLKVTGLAATKKENHERLEVTEAKGTHVIVRSEGKTLIDGYIGAYDSGTTMLRLKDQDAVATVEGSIRYAFHKQTKDFRDKVISKIETTSVTKIAFDNKNGHYEFERGGDDWKQILGKGQKPIQPLDVPKVRGIVGSASSLSASDFADAGTTPEQAGLGADAAIVTLKLSAADAGPSELVFRVGKQKDSNYYLQREGVDTIFLVSAWLGSRLQPKADDFIKKDPPKAPPPSAAAAPPPGAQQIDPALLQQLQRQMANNPHAPH